MTKPLEGRVALVAGATRAAGRGIAVALGGAGATVYATGRTTRAHASEMKRPETIEETAELVTRAGGRGIAVQVDHLVPDEVRALLARIRCTNDYNGERYRVSFFYDLAKAANLRTAFALAHELEPYGAMAVAITPGWLRSEAMLDAYGVTEANWRDAIAKQPHFAISESPTFVGRAVAALAADPERSRWNGQSLSSGQLAKVHGFTDADGSQPDAWRYLVEVQEGGKPADTTGYR